MLNRRSGPFCEILQPVGRSGRRAAVWVKGRWLSKVVVVVLRHHNKKPVGSTKKRLAVNRKNEEEKKNIPQARDTSQRLEPLLFLSFAFLGVAHVQPVTPVIV